MYNVNDWVDLVIKSHKLFCKHSHFKSSNIIEILLTVYSALVAIDVYLPGVWGHTDWCPGERGQGQPPAGRPAYTQVTGQVILYRCIYCII